jgi:hypothetical protein
MCTVALKELHNDFDVIFNFSSNTRDPVRKGGELSINMNKIKKIGDVP